MDKETAGYIITYFRNLMTDDEDMALKYHIYTYKSDGNDKLRKIMTDRGWISKKPEIKEFLRNGYEEFELNVAARIMKETPEKVFLNKCPQCNGLARTPYAKQCRHCAYRWHTLASEQD